jgi:hypothetical protein
VLLNQVVILSQPCQVLRDGSVFTVARHKAAVALVLPPLRIDATVVMVRLLAPKATHKVDSHVATLLGAERRAAVMWRICAAIQQPVHGSIFRLGRTHDNRALVEELD